MFGPGISAHVPSGWPVRTWAQAWQSFLLLPPHAVSQHRVSTQNPVLHWLSAEHAWPAVVVVPMVRVSTRTVCRSVRTRVYEMRVVSVAVSNSAGESSFSGLAEIANAAPLSTPLVPTC